MSQLDLLESSDGASSDDASSDGSRESNQQLAASEPSGKVVYLPDYRVRESKRAKHVSIKISVEGEVEVVVPPRFDRSKLPDILAKRHKWIEKTRSRLSRDRAIVADSWHIEKPETILFRWRSNDIEDLTTSNASKGSRGKEIRSKAAAKGFAKRCDQKKGTLETWSVNYQPTPGHKTLCIPDLDQQQLILQGNTDHLPACQDVLRKWLARRAQKDLAPWLRQLGFKLNLPCRKISVRGQKTCWASCSNRKDISLNFKLLFLPRPLVHYVLVHELCHTVHMNHSKQFWALVGEKQPDYQWRREAIKAAWRYVPRWVEHK